MSDDDADPELLELLRQALGWGPKTNSGPPETKVLENATYIYDNSIDVAVDMRSTREAASLIWKQMQERSYSTKTWSEHELHPKAKDEGTLDFIFTMDLLNFSFWSEKEVRKEEEEDKRFAVEFAGKRWRGYWSLVAALKRALEEDTPVTSPSFWLDEERCNEESLKHIFRSATEEQMPMLEERLDCLREAAQVLNERFDGSVAVLVSEANRSAAGLVNLLADSFPSFRDEYKFERKKVRFLKRAQIFVADVWAAFEGVDYGEFDDIDKITMFADYRVPQMLYSLGCLMYSPPLEARIRRHEIIKAGHTWEIELRGCSIWVVEQIRKLIVKEHPDAKVNAILIDFFLYDTMKEREKAGEEQIPHHRTRSIFY